MASSKDIQHSSRPINQQQQRTSISGNPSSAIPTRQTTSRTHSHSISTSLGSSHRITRRKSIINAPNNAAAIAAAVIESADKTLAMPMPPNTRRSTTARGAKMATSLGNSLGHYPSPPNSLPSHKHATAPTRKVERAVSSVEDDQHEDIEEGDEDSFDKARTRRASEGQLLAKGDKKGQGSDLRCEKCGKGYKHSSCLTKHLWEHTPEWSYTSKLLISKHQQVQLLEAASVLVQMNNDAATPPDSAKDFHSDQDSASPAASPFSGQHDGHSSADTTPPPQIEHQISESYSGSSYNSRYKRNSSSSTVFSRSYQSGPTNPNYSQWTPTSSTGFGSFQRQSAERRTPSSALSAEAQAEEASLAAAVELLSCSFGTPRSGPVSAPDVPPVPALPAQYASLGAGAFSGCTLTPSQQSHPESYRHHSNRTDDDDVQMKMEESEDSGVEDDDYDMRSRARSDEDDDGVFGRMEE